MKTSPQSQLPKTVDEYLAALPEEVRTVLIKLRKTIKSTAPKAEEAISYGMPAYKNHGALVYFAAFKNHCSFFPGSSQVVKLYDELKSFKTAKGTIQFTIDKPLPVTIVKNIVKARMKENEAREKSRKINKVARLESGIKR
jgi:uncharacterized protein YdhG (YjbR/CyaY superfamily)